MIDVNPAEMQAPILLLTFLITSFRFCLLHETSSMLNVYLNGRGQGSHLIHICLQGVKYTD